MQTLKQLIDAAARQGSLGVDRDTVTEIGDWLVGPVGHSRDSGTVEKSNWEVAIAKLMEIDPDQENHRILRFGHFACGWIEELSTRPGSTCATEAQNMRDSLDNYPVLNDDHHSSLVSEMENDNWDDIQRELRNQIHSYAQKHWDDWADEHDERLDDLDLSEFAQHYGENDGEGWIKYSNRDVKEIALKVAALFGLEINAE